MLEIEGIEGERGKEEAGHEEGFRGRGEGWKGKACAGKNRLDTRCTMDANVSNVYYVVHSRSLRRGEPTCSSP